MTKLSKMEALANSQQAEPEFARKQHYQDGDLVQLYRSLDEQQHGQWLSTFIVRVFLGTGIRLTEMFPSSQKGVIKKALATADCHSAVVDEASGRRRFPPYILLRISHKNNLPRRVVIPPYLEPYFEHHLAYLIRVRSTWFFPAAGSNTMGKPLGEQGCRERVESVLHKAGVDVMGKPVHWLRTTYASWTAQLWREKHPWGLDEHSLQAQLGHKIDSKTTNKYYLKPLTERMYNPDPPEWPEVVLNGTNNLPKFKEIRKQ